MKLFYLLIIVSVACGINAVALRANPEAQGWSLIAAVVCIAAAFLRLVCKNP